MDKIDQIEPKQDEYITLVCLHREDDRCPRKVWKHAFVYDWGSRTSTLHNGY